MTYNVIELAEDLKNSIKGKRELPTRILTLHGEEVEIKKPLALIRQLQEQRLKGYEYVSFTTEDNNKILNALYLTERRDYRQIYV